MDLIKFKKDSEKMKMPEAAVYLLRKFQSMYNDLNSLLMRSIRHMCMTCNTVTTVGGSATEEFLDSAIKECMHCTVTMNTEGASPVTIKTAKCEQGKIIITFSADPGNDHQLTYNVCK